MKTMMLPLIALALAGCEPLEAPTYRYGVDLEDHAFVWFDATEGVHPSAMVLQNPNNPFADGGVSNTGKWEIEEGGNHAVAFYGWATVLVGEPTGEAQYYAASHLEQLFYGDDVDGSEVFRVREQAIAAYTAVLDSFPEGVSYDASGTFAFRMAPLAYAGLQRLGGPIPDGWVQVETPDGPDVFKIGGGR